MADQQDVVNMLGNLSTAVSTLRAQVDELSQVVAKQASTAESRAASVDSQIATIVTRLQSAEIGLAASSGALAKLEDAMKSGDAVLLTRLANLEAVVAKLGSPTSTRIVR